MAKKVLKQSNSSLFFSVHVKKNERGLSFLGLVGVLSIVLFIGFIAFNEFSKYLRTSHIEKSSSQIKELALASKDFIKRNYTHCARNPNFSGCFKDNQSQVFSVDDIKRSGFLRMDFPEKNSYDNEYAILVWQSPRQNTSDDLQPLYIVIQTYGGQFLPNDILFDVTQKIGEEGGIISNNSPYSGDKIYVNNGAWSTETNYWQKISSRFFEPGKFALITSTKF